MAMVVARILKMFIAKKCKLSKKVLMKKIKMKVKKIERMPEVNAGGFIWIDRIIPFEVLTPLSEIDTYAIITRYFNERLDFRFRKNKKTFVN